ncbi:MAG: EFR1 family ferrodoxin [Spirochaetaceae bacterium]|nr:EFR1 family ferrodoxin [Spirochaetaceae bacterium]
MNGTPFKRIVVLYFSPTGNARKVATEIGEKISQLLQLPVDKMSFTLPKEREKNFIFGQDDIVICTTPVYAGRLPNKILPFIQENIKGNGAIAITVNVFGNRNYDNAPIEFYNEMKKNGFKVIAVAAVPTEHVFLENIGRGRPTLQDMTSVLDFAEKAGKKILEGNLSDELDVPGAYPAAYYTPLGVDNQPVQFLKAKPETHLELCDSCGACARRCPMGAISFEDTSLVPGVCIKCQTCVKICHTKAKHFTDQAFLSHVQMLANNYQHPAEGVFVV